MSISILPSPPVPEQTFAGDGIFRISGAGKTTLLIMCKCDYKHEAKGSHPQTLASDFIAVITALANDVPLAEKHRDHALTGNWKDHRDCHVKSDLVLVYRKAG